jgi:hypothetical protein
MAVTFDDVRVGRIFIDLNNPRHEPFTSEPQAVEYLCRTEGVFPLARDIRRHGLNPLERVALIPVKATGGRITLLKEHNTNTIYGKTLKEGRSCEAPATAVSPLFVTFLSLIYDRYVADNPLFSRCSAAVSPLFLRC